MTTTQKEKNFASSPLKEHDEWKKPSSIGGIVREGPAEKAFEKEGYFKAYQIVGQYMRLEMNEELFKQWLADIMEKNDVQLSAQHMDSCYTSIKVWCNNNL